jgi:hypothetical protein
MALGDVTLAQKIALATEESLALSVANSFPGADRLAPTLSSSLRG